MEVCGNSCRDYATFFKNEVIKLLSLVLTNNTHAFGGIIGGVYAEGCLMLENLLLCLEYELGDGIWVSGKVTMHIVKAVKFCHILWVKYTLMNFFWA